MRNKSFSKVKGLPKISPRGLKVRGPIVSTTPSWLPSSLSPSQSPVDWQSHPPPSPTQFLCILIKCYMERRCQGPEKQTGHAGQIGWSQSGSTPSTSGHPFSGSWRWLASFNEEGGASFHGENTTEFWPLRHLPLLSTSDFKQDSKYFYIILPSDVYYLLQIIHVY